jgi:hypothetical protein
MAFTLDKVVPWGRSFAEYIAMFALSDRDLRKRIMGCGDGPAAFNAGLTQQGGQVVSVDPLYRFSGEEIHQRIAATYPEVMEQTRQNQGEFIWTTIKSVEELGRQRLAAMAAFLADFALGLAQGRYLDGQLPQLPFRDGDFDLAVCSHLLFLYGEQFSEEFHVASIKELCRVAGEARVFPLLELGAKPSRHLPAVISHLAADGYGVTVVPVPYEFQRGGNQMLRILSN